MVISRDAMCSYNSCFSAGDFSGKRRSVACCSEGSNDCSGSGPSATVNHIIAMVMYAMTNKICCQIIRYKRLAGFIIKNIMCSDDMIA